MDFSCERAPQRYHPLVPVLGAAATGISADYLIGNSFLAWCAISFVALFGWLAARRGHRLTLAAVLLLVAFAAAAGAWHHMRWRLFDVDELGRSATAAARPVCLEGVCLSMPRLWPAPPDDPMRTMPAHERSVFRVSARRVRDAATWKPAAGKCRVAIEGQLGQLAAGDQVRIVGLLFAPSAPRNPGEFNFAADRRQRRELCVINCRVPECVTIVKRRTTWSPLANPA